MIRIAQSPRHHRYCVVVREKSFIVDLKKKKKKKDRWNRANITRNRSPVSLPSFLLVGMHQNVCRLPGSVSIRFVWKFTRGGPGWIFIRRMIALITSIFSYRIMLISKLSNVENDEKNKISRAFVTRNGYFWIYRILLSDRKIFSSLIDYKIKIRWFFLNAIFSFYNEKMHARSKVVQQSKKCEGESICIYTYRLYERKRRKSSRWIY